MSTESKIKSEFKLKSERLVICDVSFLAFEKKQLQETPTKRTWASIYISGLTNIRACRYNKYNVILGITTLSDRKRSTSSIHAVALEKWLLKTWIPRIYTDFI